MEGTCNFTAKLSDGGTIQLPRAVTLTAAGTNLNWIGGKTEELDLAILSDSESGQITWNLTCTDLGGVGYGASASASGTYDLSLAPTPPPTNPPTDTPAPATATPAPQAS